MHELHQIFKIHFLSITNKWPFIQDNPYQPLPEKTLLVFTSNHKFFWIHNTDGKQFLRCFYVDSKECCITFLHKCLYNCKIMYEILKKVEAKDVLPNINCTQAAERAEKISFLSLVILTFDLQTRLSEGPKTSSVWIWLKSIQRFPQIIHTQTKTTHWWRQKTEPFTVHCMQ